MKSVSSLSLAFLATCTLPLASAHPNPKISTRQDNSGFANPTSNSGSFLTQIPGSNLGEPINVIISSQSDSAVLTTQGFGEYMTSLYFSPGDCFGVSSGGLQAANLGDGNGYVNQSEVLRYNYMQGDDGTCYESLNGGNHARWWKQNGTAADTNAIFMAASVEMNAQANHMIVDNGYDLGRDLLTGNATISNGTKSEGGFEYMTTSTQQSLLSGIDASQINHGIAIDGNVNILTVRITKQGTIGSGSSSNPTSSGSGGSSAASALSVPSSSSILLAGLAGLALFGCSNF